MSLNSQTVTSRKSVVVFASQNTVESLYDNNDEICGRHRRGGASCYDLLSVIFVNLDKKGEGASNLLEMLSLLFLGEMKALEKCKALESKFGIAMYQEISEEVSNMCDLSAGVWERGIEQGFSQGIAQGISQGIAQERNNMFDLLSKLYASGRAADIERAAKDRDYLNKLLADYHS